jgi:hypothetical protein
MRYDSNGSHEIVLNRSNNGGQTWLGEERITYTPEESNRPWVSWDNGKIHVVWREGVPDGVYDIFYKNYIPDSTDKIEEPDISFPSDFFLSAYPNPFNSSVLISVQAPSGGTFSIYDLAGREICRYELSGDRQQIRWEAKDSAGKGVASGIYLARLHSESGQSAQVKLVYLK